ncbi:MAG: thrombospondin type 3 repeat-containing protein [Spirochaetaceae bacterium]|nr:thrombospondin type 3 repeat-containing protein [Myxococcales bacterium]MCB9723929.1 thrombospondin type 3 repeat-containing protein [Spirochaetaceae bacterium]
MAAVTERRSSASHGILERVARARGRLATCLIVGLALCSAAASAQDTDLDGVDDSRDNCLTIANPDQLDADLDGYGTACDADYNNDGLVSGLDFATFLTVYGGPGPIANHDSVGVVSGTDFAYFLSAFQNSELGPSGLSCAGTTPCNGCPFRNDVDSDADGIVDSADNCPYVANGPAAGDTNQLDSNGDGHGNACDADFNEDHHLNYSDFLLWYAAFGGSGPEVAEFDLDGDGLVSSIDFTIILTQFPALTQPGVGPRLSPSPMVSCDIGLPIADELLPPSLPEKIHVVERSSVFEGSLLEQSTGYPVSLDLALLATPEAGIFTQQDRDTFAYHYTPDASSTLPLNSLEYTLGDHFGTPSDTGRVDFVIKGGAGTPYTGTELNDNVLVVYNTNSSGADTIASYYATERGIPSAQVCPISMPNGLYADVEQLLSARKQIVENCICPLVPVAERPSPCEVGPALAELASVSPISHLALIRGLPARFYGADFPTNPGGGDAGGEEEPSLDFYLAYLLYRDEDLFCPGCPGPASGPTGRVSTDFDEQAGFGISREISPGLDRFVAYGRVEAITVDRTLDLIDRTLAAEAAGFRGNVLSEYGNDLKTSLNLMGESSSACIDYVSHTPFVAGDPQSTWPSATCRAGGTYSSANPATNGILPGLANSHVPFAEDVGFLIGGNPYPNGQAGFNNFSNMLRWRVGGTTCTALCEDLSTPAERAACAAASTDYFQELNSDCVGVATGFMGQQVRSFPVGFYGFFPPGWLSGDTGANESSTPEIRSGGAYSDATFTDDRYIHFGVHDHTSPDLSQCATTSGTVVACPERIAVRLMSNSVVLTAPDNIVLSGDRDFLVTVRHRNKANPGGRLRVSMRFFDGPTLVTTAGTPIVLGTDTLGTWTTSTSIVTASAAQLTQIDKIQVILSVELEEGVTDYVDLDAIEVVDTEDPSPSNLLPQRTASFDPIRQNQTHRGDYAANAIDRLGGIAFWGSSGHHRTGGFAFGSPGTTFRRLFDGFSLAEAILSVGGGESGIIYGDPLYRASVAALVPTVDYTARISATSSYNPAIVDPFSIEGDLVTPENIATKRKAILSALHGTANVGSTEWRLALCATQDLAVCDAQGLWTTVDSGVGAVRERTFDWVALLANPSVDQDVVIRLEVVNPGEPELALYDYLFYDLRVE